MYLLMYSLCVIFYYLRISHVCMSDVLCIYHVYLFQLMGPLGAILGPSWAILKSLGFFGGPSWGHPGASRGNLGAFSGPHQAILGTSWAILGPLGPILGPSWGHLGPLRPFLGPLGAICGPLGSIVAPSRDHLGVRVHSNSKNINSPFAPQFQAWRNARSD